MISYLFNDRNFEALEHTTQEVGVVSVLGKIPTNSVDVDAVSQHARLYPPKALEA
jgi:hypothetical protein